MEAIHAGTKRKRRRLEDDLPEFIAKKARNTRKLKSAFESIFEKYGQDFTDVGDEIDLETGEIVVDNGHVQGIQQESDTEEDEDTPASPNKKQPKTRPGWSLWTPQIIKGPYKKKNRKIPLAVPNADEASSDEEEQDEGGVHEFEEELLNQIRNHGDRQRSKSVVSGIDRHPVEDDPSFEEPADLTMEDDDPGGTTAIDPPAIQHHKNPGVDRLSEESRRLIRLRNQGLTFTEMEPYFNGRKRPVLQTMWAKLDKQYPELTGPGDILATALADIAAGRLRTDRGQTPSWHFNRSFSKEEDRLLINLRKKGMQFVTMVPKFERRTSTTLQHRFKRLAQDRPELKQYLGRLAKRPSERSEPSLFVTDDDAEHGEQLQALLESNRKGAYQKWHSEEDALILQLYAKGVRFADMCPYLKNRSEITVRGRYKKLVKGTQKRSKDKTKTRDQKNANRRRSAPGANQGLPPPHDQRVNQDEESGHVVSEDSTQSDAVEPEQPRDGHRRSLPARHAPRVLNSEFVSSLVIDPGSAVPADRTWKPWDRWRGEKISSTTPVSSHPTTYQTTTSPQIKRRRGRPRKHPLPTPQPSASDGDDAVDAADTIAAPANEHDDLIAEPEQYSVTISIPSTPLERGKISVRCPRLPSDLRRDKSALQSVKSGKRNKTDLDFLGSETASDFDPYLEDDKFKPLEEDDDLPQDQTTYSESDTDSLPQVHTTRTLSSRTPKEKARFTEPIDNTDHDTSLSAMPSSFEARRSQNEHSQQAQLIDVDDLAADDDDDADDEVEDEEAFIDENEAILADDDVEDIEDDTTGLEGLNSVDVEETPEAQGGVSQLNSAKLLQPSGPGSGARKRGQRRTVWSARRKSNKPTYDRWLKMIKPGAEAGKKRGRPRKSETSEASPTEVDATLTPSGEASAAQKGPTSQSDGPENPKHKSQDSEQTPSAVDQWEHEEIKPLTEVVDLCDESEEDGPEAPTILKAPPPAVAPKTIERPASFRKSLPLRTPLHKLLKRSGFGDDDSSEDELCTPGRLVKVK